MTALKTHQQQNPQESQSQKPLLWFHHFHKCAGTFVINSARKAGRKFWPQESNGIPCDREGQFLPIGEYDDAKLMEFVENCLAVGVQFVATEFGAPNFHLLAKHPQIQLITVLRDPWDRFWSNYVYDVRCGFTNARTVEEYHRSAGEWTYFNYFVNLLSRRSPIDDNPTEVDFARATHALQCFDLCLVQEDTSFTNRIERFFGVESLPKNTRNRASGPNWRMLMGRARRGELRPLWTALTADLDTKEAFRERFAASNALDIQLYEKRCDRTAAIQDAGSDQ